MGLDWLVGIKAKPGHEEAFDAMVDAIVHGDEDGVDPEAFSAVGIPAFECVGAPVVGTDALADAWLLQRVRAQAGDSVVAALAVEEVEPSPQNDQERAVLEQAAGYRVLELAPASPGLPVYSHGAIMEELELTSFRGKFLRDAEPVVGSELVESAWVRKTPAELVAYGEALLARARAYAAEHGLEGLEDQVEPPDVDEEHPSSRAHIAFAAGKWCVYWGSRGHWLDVWF